MDFFVQWGVTAANPALTAAKLRSHFLPGATVVAPGSTGAQIQAQLDATGNVELGLGTYTGGFRVRDGQRLVGIPYGSRITGNIVVENGAKVLMRGLIMDGGCTLEAGNLKTGGTIEITLGNINANGAYLEDMQFISNDGQHSLVDMRINRVEFSRVKSHGATGGPAVKVYGRSRAEVTNLVFVSSNHLQPANSALDLRTMTDVTLLGVDDESYADRASGPSINLQDITNARVVASGGSAGNADGIYCSNVDNLIVMVQGQTQGGSGKQPLNISGATRAFLIGCNGVGRIDTGGTTRITQGQPFTMTKTGTAADQAILLGNGTPWLGWAREVAAQPAPYTPPGGLTDETAAINAMGQYVVLQDRAYKASGINLTPGRIFRGGPNTVIVGTAGQPVFVENFAAGGAAPTTSGGIFLDVRIHGGSEGILFGESNSQCTNMVLSGVTLTNQTVASLSVRNTYAIDNCHTRCVTIDNSTGGGQGIRQRGTDDGSGTGPMISYIDKWFFDRPQFFSAPLDLVATRQSNLNVFRKGLSVNCNHHIDNHYAYTCFVGHSFTESPLDTEVAQAFIVDCDVTKSTSGFALGSASLCEGCTFNLSGGAVPFNKTIQLVWQLFYINSGCLNCTGAAVNPEYINTAAQSQSGISFFSSMSNWASGPWQGVKLRTCVLDTKGTVGLNDDVRTNVTVVA